MPDPNPEEHPENIPELPHNFHIAKVGTDYIDAGWKWCIGRVGRIPQKTHGFIFEYDKKTSISELFYMCETYSPQVSPQPAFHVTNVSKPGNPSDSPAVFLKPDTEYVLLFCSVNAAGRSEYFGTFDPESGIITPIKTKVVE
jgi:hypothetical protein